MTTTTTSFVLGETTSTPLDFRVPLPPPRPRIHETVRAIRRRFGLSQRGLAALAGLTRGQVAYMETPGCDHRIASLARIAYAVGMEWDLALVPPDGPTP